MTNEKKLAMWFISLNLLAETTDNIKGMTVYKHAFKKKVSSLIADCEKELDIFFALNQARHGDSIELTEEAFNNTEYLHKILAAIASADEQLINDILDLINNRQTQGTND